ncbi:acyl-CoA dehydrogenase family protein [Hydrogenophaga sp.]|uniref:acyl-CoA dehydrogenase family protein n=1 Tax=Hydrogenophaga sp. TaxID=1904254 RepID=UPI002617C628|nr:acyl-CoA dehydrogenase family protein [Hydrogenophaga sp.]MCW5652186.1 acyl-CoA dehydrogenase family protein [Hydrogenophaga sp.]
MNLDDFRLETRAWLEAHCPPEMRQPVVDDERCWGGRKWVFHSEAQRVWLQRMAERGWVAPTWPREYGGGGLSHEEAKVLREEMDALHCRPPIERVSQGLGLLGPTILRLGTPGQKAEHLPGIARGEIRWCQGYSEPNAGSDLASIQTRAVDAGDHFVVNGQKIWTSHADKSDWIFMLVRTDAHAPKHRGISFLLVDMATPGIQTRPIQLISGKSAFCETFFDDVMVPKENLLGELNQGWEVSRLLLANERGSIAATRSLAAERSLGLSAMDWVGAGEGGRLSDAGLREDIARYEVDMLAFTAAAERAGDLGAAGQAGPGWPSILKLSYAELNQKRLELLMAAGGTELLEWEGERTRDGEECRAWLRSKANTIEGGSTEIQLNIIAKRVLDLPGA